MPVSLAARRISPHLLLAAVVAACSSGPTAPGHASAPLYVANYAGQRITVYSASANGNATPVATIAGSNTSLNFPYGIARDTAGRLYVRVQFSGRPGSWGSLRKHDTVFDRAYDEGYHDLSLSWYPAQRDLRQGVVDPREARRRRESGGLLER
jgi:DNA-binding beta-propeller fold protein YncE